jgi:hypothetical protein
MGIPSNSICNKTGGAVDPAWLEELHLAYDETVRLLDELKALGHDYKMLECLVLRGSPGAATWCGLSETRGVVSMNPHEHQSRAIAHEMGHGFEEVWRSKPGHEEIGDPMCEAIRFFVEKRLGSDKRWKPREDWTSVLDVCCYDLEKFKKELDGKIAQLAKE